MLHHPIGQSYSGDIGSIIAGYIQWFENIEIHSLTRPNTPEPYETI